MFGDRTGILAVFTGVRMFAACTYHPSRFPIYGTAGDRSRLAGAWFGEFTSAGTGRGDTIPGRYVSRSESTIRYGAWRVARRSAATDGA